MKSADSVPPPASLPVHRPVDSAPATAKPARVGDARVREPEAHLHRALRYVAHAVRRRHPRSDPDDLFQTAVVVACQHAHRYDPTRGASMATFVKRRAHGALIDQQRNEHRHARFLARLGEEHAVLEPTCARSPEQLLEEAEERELRSKRIATALAELSRIDRELVCRRMIEEVPLAELARELGLVEHKAAYRLRKAVVRLKRSLERRG